jgi:hypothetical protein
MFGRIFVNVTKISLPAALRKCVQELLMTSALLWTQSKRRSDSGAILSASHAKAEANCNLTETCHKPDP